MPSILLSNGDDPMADEDDDENYDEKCETKSNLLLINHIISFYCTCFQ